MSDRRFIFETTCINSTYELMYEMLDENIVLDITLRTFARAIGREQWTELQSRLGYDHWLPISKDWHVSYHRGVYKNRRCYFMCWSGIEHIYLEEKYVDYLERTQ